jgi:hypothetical protein
LMLGVVRIYSRQLQYLYDDCQRTINKLDMVRLAPDVPTLTHPH